MKHVFDRLNEIAAAIEPFEAAWLQAWNPRLATVDMEKALTESAARLNAAIEPFVDEVAQVTNNSASTIRQAFCPKNPYHVWFSGHASPSAYLRNVAKHSSFNTEFWAENERRADERLLKDAYLSALDDVRKVASSPGLELASVPPKMMPVVTPAAAAAEIAAGRVPRVDERLLPQLKAELLKVGVLELYNAPQDRDSYSATRPFAYVADGAGEFRFWPKNRAMNYVCSTPLGKLSGGAPTAGPEPVVSKQPRNRP